MPKISVIIPAYHHEKYIGAAIDSILDQSFSDLEIVAINDGSPDQTGNILDTYAAKEKRIRVFHQENVGVAETLNRGIQYATGEWIAFCGSDDTYPPDALKRLIRKTEKADVVIGEYTLMAEDQLPRDVRYPHRKRTFAQLMYTSGAMWGKLFRRKFILEHQLRFPSLTMEEDTVMIAQMVICAPRFAIARGSTYCYWTHTDNVLPSLTHRSDAKSFEQRMKGKGTMLELFRRHGFSDEWEAYWVSSLCLLSDDLLGIFDPEEREYAFRLFQNFVMQHDWTGKEDLFGVLFHMTPEEFRQNGLELFYRRNICVDSRERTYQRFSIGQAGLRYIARYTSAWMKFKRFLWQKRRNQKHGE